MTVPETDRSDIDTSALDAQRRHWEDAFSKRPQMFGADPSEPGRKAADMFTAAGVVDVLELGAGQGRDSHFFIGRGLRVTALDYTSAAIEDLAASAASTATAESLQRVQHDVRQPLPFAGQSFDACYSHMLFCMALTTLELERLSQEVRRVLRPGGLHVYTARTTEDPHYGTGIDRGDQMHEVGGFIVHFFDDELIRRLASGFELLEVDAFEESSLPRRLVRVTARRAEGRLQ